MSSNPTELSPVPDPERREGSGSWVVRGGSTQGLARYLEAIRDGRWIIIGTLVVCVIAAALYLSQASTVYETETDLLVSPQPALSVSVPIVITQSSDPTRDIETVARLVTSTSVAREVQQELDLSGDVRGVLNRVTATPLAQSNIVSIQARAGSAREAAALSDAFAQQFVASRTQRLREALDPQIEQLQAQIGSDTSNAAADANPDSPQSQLRVLQQLRRGGDPSVTLESRAEIPTSPVSPRPLLTIVAAIVGGGVLGIIGAFLLGLLDPRLRREEQLRLGFRLPILARIPLERRKRRRPLLPSELSLGALDGYQALRVALSSSRGNALAGRVVLVTSPTPGDGKSTASINLASTLAASGKRVILIEADSRRPKIGIALGMQAEVGLASVIAGSRYLVDALQPVGEKDSKLRVLLTKEDEAPAADVLSHLSTDTLLLQARRLADWVIIDSPPLAHVAETLTMARGADEVVIVTRVGSTNVRDLNELSETLEQQDITPAGFIVLGGQARKGYY